MGIEWKWQNIENWIERRTLFFFFPRHFSSVRHLIYDLYCIARNGERTNAGVHATMPFRNQCDCTMPSHFFALPSLVSCAPFGPQSLMNFVRTVGSRLSVKRSTTRRNASTLRWYRFSDYRKFIRKALSFPLSSEVPFRVAESNDICRGMLIRELHLLISAFIISHSGRADANDVENFNESPIIQIRAHVFVSFSIDYVNSRETKMRDGNANVYPSLGEMNSVSSSEEQRK